MVQVIKAKPGFGTKFSEGFQPSFQQGMQRFLEEQTENKNLEKENFALKRLGIDVEGVRNPNARLALLQQHIKNNPSQGEVDADEKNYEVIKDTFGDKFANVWKSVGQGERTNLTKAALEASLRGQDVKSIFENAQVGPKSTGFQQPPSEQGEFPEYKLNTQGMTPAESVKFKKEIRGYNTPILNEAIQKNKALDNQLNAVRDLEKLSPQMPDGLSRVFINPKTGNLRPWAQILQLAPPEAELYTKIINDFTTQAKDSFGSRVTNFDLDQFMKRLPTLSNSKEGRDLILRRMKLTSEAEKLYNKKLKETYRHYGADNITPEDADSLAEALTMDESEKLREEAVQIDSEMEKLSENRPDQNAPEGFVLMLDPQGNPLHVPEQEVEKLLSLGAKRAQ